MVKKIVWIFILSLCTAFLIWLVLSFFEIALQLGAGKYNFFMLLFGGK